MESKTSAGELRLSWDQIRREKKAWLDKEKALPFSNPKRPSVLTIKAWEEILAMDNIQDVSRWVKNFQKKYPYPIKRDNPTYKAAVVCLSDIITAWTKLKE